MYKIFLIFLGLLTLLQTYVFAAPTPPVTLTAAVEQPVCREGQPAVLALALYNSGTQRFIIDGSAFEESSFQISVTDEAGHTVPRTAVGERVLTPPMSVFRNSTVALTPGQTLSYRFNLARLFDLSRTGTYTINVSRRLRPQIWPPEINLLAPPSTKTSSVAVPPAIETPPQEFTLTANPLTVRMIEDASAVSGPTAYAPPPNRQTFLYMASQYSPGVSRYRVSEDGGVSFALEPYAPSPSTLLSSPALRAGPAALAATPDGRYLYAGNAGDNTVSQFRIGDNGLLSPLFPPTVPAQKFPGHLLMDPKGRFLYALSNWGNTLYAIGPDGRLTVTALIPVDVWAKDRDRNPVPSDFGAIDPAGTFLYACNGLAFGYRLAPDGGVTALPRSTAGAADPNGIRANAIALSPDGKFAFVGVSKEDSSAFFDLVVPMRVAQDGTLIPLPGAQTPQSPPLPWPGYQPFQCTTLTVDPTGRFLVVVNTGFLDCFRIGPGGAVTPLGMTEEKGGLDSVFFVPGSRIAYVHNANPPTLLAFRLDDQHGLIPAGLDMPDGVPFDACMTSAVAPTPLKWGPVSGGICVSASLRADVLSANAPVVLTVILKNVTKHPIRLGAAGTEMSSFRLSLFGPQRQSPGALWGGGEPLAGPVPLLAAGHEFLEMPGSSPASVVLPPGGLSQYRLVLSRLADLTVAGNYTIRVMRFLPDATVAASLIVPFLLDGPFDGSTRDGKHQVQIL